MRRTKDKRLGLAGALVLIAALTAPLANAAEITRDEYVTRVEPICKVNVDANKKIFKGAKEEVKAGELKKGSTHFLRASTALDKTIKQLRAVPQPTTDEAKLAKWLGYLKTEADLFERIGLALKAEDKHKAQNLSVLLNRNSNLANNTVLAFGFNYCRIDPSRFS